MTYVAPVQDMVFVLNELAGLSEIAMLPGYEDVTPDLVGAVLEEASRFAQEVLSPLNAIGDRQGSKLADGVVKTPQGFKEAYRRFAENGWMSLNADPAFGGQGLPHALGMAVKEMWQASNMAFALCPMLTEGATEAIAHHGSEPLKNTYLPRMVAGEWTGTMDLTEPQAGSDLSQVLTKAVPDGAHYRIAGTKIFITWGEHDMADNIIHLVLARLPDAPEGVKGISLFVVPKFLIHEDGSLGASNDVICPSVEHKMGIHASPTAVLAFGEKGGAIGYLVGELNRGLEYMFTMMNHARLSVGLQGVGIADRAYQQALGYALERVQGRVIGRGAERLPIAYHPDVRRMLMSMKCQVEAMRALTYFVAGAIDRAQRHTDTGVRDRSQGLVDLLVPAVKGWCTEQSIEIASTGIQIHGGMGFSEETGACQHLRDARITTIYEGTTGIQANDLLGRKIARENGVTAKALIEEMRGAVGELGTKNDEGSQAIAASLAGGIEALEQATDWVLKTYPRNPAAAASGSVPYLKLFGTVAGGWQMARAAQAAQAKIEASAGDDKFYRTKIATARFYASHIMPQALALKEIVQRGVESQQAGEEVFG